MFNSSPLKNDGLEDYPFLWDGTFSWAMLIFQGRKLLVKQGRCLEEIAVRFFAALELCIMK